MMAFVTEGAETIISIAVLLIVWAAPRGVVLGRVRGTMPKMPNAVNAEK